MSLFYFKQSSFAGGEISPDGWGRDDLAKYSVSAKTMRNFFPHPFGGASNRQGTNFIAEAKVSTAVRAVPFKFSSEQAYILEFGNLYIRPYKDGGQVLSGGVPVEIATTYTTAELFDLKFAQSADTLYICHPNHKPATLTRSSHTAWTLADMNFTGGPFRTANTGAITITPSGYGGAIVLTASEDLFDSTWVGSLVKVSHDVINQVSYNTLFGDQTSSTLLCKGNWTLVTHGTWKGGLNLQKSLDGVTYETIRFYSSDGAYNVNDSGTTDNEYCLLRLTCNNITEDSCKVDMTCYSFINDGIVQVTALSDARNVQVNCLTGISYVTPTTDWAEGAWSAKHGYPRCCKFYQNRLAFAGTTKDPLTVWLSQSGDYTNFTTNLPSESSDAVTAPLVSQGVNVVRSMVSIGSLLAFTAGGLWKISGGSDTAITPSSILATQQEYGGASSIEPVVIKNRVIYCQEMGSIVSDVGYSLQDDSYMGDDLSVLVRHLLRGYSVVDWCYQREPDSILWIVRNDGELLSLTYNKAQQVYAWAHHDTDGYFESCATIPGETSDEVWFVVRRTIGASVKRYVERFSTIISDDPRQQFYVDSGLTLDVPLSIYTITNTLPVQISVIAHGLQPGDLVDVSDVVGMTEMNDNRYEVFEVNENNFTLKDMDTGVVIDSTGFEVYVSGGYVRKVVSTISGLSHLEGETVSVLADGGVQESQVVASGAITLASPASIVHVGLPYICDLETLNIDFPLKDGTIQGRNKAVRVVTVRLENSRGGWVGVNGIDNLREFETVLAEEYGDPTLLVTNDVSVVPYSENSTDARIWIRQTDPLPITVLNIMGEVEIIGN